MKDGIQRMNCSIYFKGTVKSDTVPFMQTFGDGHSGGRDTAVRSEQKKNRHEKKTFFERAVYMKYPFHQET